MEQLAEKLAKLMGTKVTKSEIHGNTITFLLESGLTLSMSTREIEEAIAKKEYLTMDKMTKYQNNSPETYEQAMTLLKEYYQTRRAAGEKLPEHPALLSWVLTEEGVMHVVDGASGRKLEFVTNQAARDQVLSAQQAEDAQLAADQAETKAEEAKLAAEQAETKAKDARTKAKEQLKASAEAEAKAKAEAKADAKAEADAEKEAKADARKSTK